MPMAMRYNLVAIKFKQSNQPLLMLSTVYKENALNRDFILFILNIDIC